MWQLLSLAILAEHVVSAYTQLTKCLKLIQNSRCSSVAYYRNKFTSKIIGAEPWGL